ncbi:class I SAM-dependent methyltransferase [Cohnella panacarvi]|uniref:class I SAM-dependent methyltransferase n=1 Tax=Cohnella panacarvi TaxID=400776 RepID=UPI00047C2049|nr:class I SAM-dependent methyltransferase [Cohnella panacarvi]
MEQKVHWEAAKYDGSMGFVSEYGLSLLEWLRPQAGESMIDFGCGTGDLAARIAESGAEVLGVDISPEMVERARVKYPNIGFECGDGTTWRSPRLFDAAFSNAALHWMKDARAVATTIASSLRIGGRFVAEFGGYGNVRDIVRAMRETLEAQGRMDAFVMPWYFPKLGEYASVLEQEGFEVRKAMLFDRPTPLEDGEQGMMGWLRMFGHAMVPNASAAESEAWFEEACERLNPVAYKAGQWTAGYRRIRVEAVKLG